MNYLEEGHLRPGSSTPPVGSPILGGYIDGVAQSFRSNQFRPPSPIPTQQQAKQNDGQSLFKRHKVDFTPDEPITHLATGRNRVIIASKDKKVTCIDTTSSKQTDCDLARCLGNRLAQSRVHKLFLDPTGKFALISLAYASDNQPLENLLHVKQTQLLPRLKNHLISAVAWNHPKTNSAVTSSSSTTSTGTILVGTTKGLVLQTEFIHSDETKFFPLSPGPRQYVKEVFDIGSEVGAITGLEYHQIPSSSTTEKSFVILVATNNRLYRMVGSVPANADPPPLHLIFSQNSTNYKEVPGRFINSKLDFYYPSANSPPTRFAWLTEPGVMTSQIFNQLQACKSSFESNEDINIIPYTAPKDSEELLSSSTPSGMSPLFGSMIANYNDKPISMVVTNFHVIILFRHCIKAVCILNDVTIYEEYFTKKYGNILGMSKDSIKSVIWVYCERAVFKYKLANENKNIWKIYLDQKRFDLAKKYSSGDESNYDRVICEEAQHYFRLKNYEKSAEIFARSKKPFEDVSLMFMEVKSSKALKKYLMIRIEQYESVQVTQLTITLAWLLEIIISSISVLQTQQPTDKINDELDDIYQELDQLLDSKQVVECLANHSTLFYGIMRNYSNWDTFVRIAKLIGDYERVVQCYIDQNEFVKALEIMRAAKKEDLFYKYGHILMKRHPKEFVDALIEQPSIRPSKLISILIQENPYFNKCNETIRYLEHCVKNLRTENKVIHNYLFELYARHRNEKVVMEYLENEIPSDGTQQHYLDLQLCLRLCTELKLTNTCVALYSLMELYDEAVHLALSFDVELAKAIARKAESEDHQKRLWLAIAENVLTRDLDIRIATRLLKECRLLKIEDILPFFPDYTTIDYFRDAIRQSLQEYQNQILTLKDETYDDIADSIRTEIKTFRNRYSIIKVGQRCQICSRNLLSRTFYVFPCGHLFHSDCIIKELISIDHSITNDLDQIISSECIYCGSLLPTYIDKPAPISVESEDD